MITIVQLVKRALINGCANLVKRGRRRGEREEQPPLLPFAVFNLCGHKLTGNCTKNIQSCLLPAALTLGSDASERNGLHITEEERQKTMTAGRDGMRQLTALAVRTRSM